MQKLNILLENELLTSLSDSVSHGIQKPFLISRSFGAVGTISWLIALLLAMMPVPSFSQITTGGDQILEIMINGEADDQGALTLTEPWLLSDSVGYTYTCDYNAMTYNYSTLPNQSIGGQPTSITTSGSYDSASSLFTWTTAGSVGGDTISSSGSIDLASDPTSSGTWTFANSHYGVQTRTYKDSYTATGGTDTGTITYYDGTTSLGFVNTKSSRTPQKIYNNYVRGGGIYTSYVPQFTGTYVDNGVGQVTGSFIQSVVLIPEPSAFAMLGLGTLCLLAYNWRRQKAKV